MLPPGVCPVVAVAVLLGGGRSPMAALVTAFRARASLVLSGPMSPLTTVKRYRFFYLSRFLIIHTQPDMVSIEFISLHL